MSGRGGGRGGGGGWRGGRGGGGGGGGGFGRGRGPDLGEDVEVTYKETPLFPEYQANPFKPLTPAERHMVDGWRSFTDGLRDLPFYIDVPPTKPDIVRYSDRFRRSTNEATKSLHRVATDLKFFPDELHVVKDPTKGRMGPKLFKKDIDLKALDALEREEATNKGEVVDNDDEPLPEEDYDEEQFEDDNDYLIDHYDEDADVFGGEASGGEEY